MADGTRASRQLTSSAEAPLGSGVCAVLSMRRMAATWSGPKRRKEALDVRSRSTSRTGLFSEIPPAAARFRRSSCHRQHTQTTTHTMG